MNQGGVNFKVFLRNGNTTDVRRFIVEDSSVVTNYMFMREKLCSIFPVLRQQSYKITWADVDGDEITIVTDEDLITAFTEMTGHIKVLYVTVAEGDNPQETGPDFHATFGGRNVVCDVCDKVINGYRYKCMQCPDYDLCAACEQSGNHSHHVMLRVSHPELPRCMSKMMTCLARSMRKGHFDARTSFRGKLASAAAGAKAKCGKDKGKCEKKSECPMVDNLFMDLSVPIMKVLQQPSGASAEAAAASAEAAASQLPDVIGNLIRNAVQTIFGELPRAQQPQQPEPSTSTNSAHPNPGEGAAAQVTPTQETPAQGVPSAPVSVASSFASSMEVEAPRQPIYPIIPNEFTQKEKTDLPDWTFIGQDGQRDLLTGNEHPRVAEGLKQLLEMGFSNEDQLIALLRRYDGNVGFVIKHLFENNSRLN